MSIGSGFVVTEQQPVDAVASGRLNSTVVTASLRRCW